MADKKPGEAYMQKQSSSIYTACEEYDFCWDRKELVRFREMWEAGFRLMDIAKTLGRHVNEVAILVIDQAEHGKISARVGGLYGQAV